MYICVDMKAASASASPKASPNDDPFAPGAGR